MTQNTMSSGVTSFTHAALVIGTAVLMVFAWRDGAWAVSVACLALILRGAGQYGSRQ